MAVGIYNIKHMTKQEIIGKIRVIISKTLRIPIERVTPESSFESLEVDSIDCVQILMNTEYAFSIEIPDDITKALRAVGSLANYIETILNEKN